MTTQHRGSRVEKRPLGSVRPKIEPIFASMIREPGPAIGEYLARSRRDQAAYDIRRRLSNMNARTEIGVGYWTNEHDNSL